MLYYVISLILPTTVLQSRLILQVRNLSYCGHNFITNNWKSWGLKLDLSNSKAWVIFTMLSHLDTKFRERGNTSLLGQS